MSEASDRRLNMRLNPAQAELLRAAAGAQGQSVTGFVLGAATERARDVLREVHRMEITRQEFDRFARALDEPAEPMPVLRRHARR